MKLKRLNFEILIFSVVLLLFGQITIGCDGRQLPKNVFTFDKEYYDLFKAITKPDTLFFTNTRQSLDTFILTTIDSSIVDQIDCFICPSAGKSISRQYRQYPINRFPESKIIKEGIASNRSVDKEASIATITIDPVNKLTTIHIFFKNFRGFLTGDLGEIHKDTLRIDGTCFTAYYIFTTAAKSLIQNDSDVELLYVTLKNGIVAYREKSGVLRKRLVFP